jgi:hypothetical protein
LHHQTVTFYGLEITAQGKNKKYYKRMNPKHFYLFKNYRPLSTKKRKIFRFLLPF